MLVLFCECAKSEAVYDSGLSAYRCLSCWREVRDEYTPELLPEESHPAYPSNELSEEAKMHSRLYEIQREREASGEV